LTGVEGECWEAAVAGRDTVKNFMAFGVPRRAARAMAEYLESEVTLGVCALLPDVEYSVAPATMVIARAMLAKLIPDLTGLIAGGGDAFAERGVVSSSLLPVILCEGINSGLVERARKAEVLLGRGMGSNVGRPEPSADLVSASRFQANEAGIIPAAMRKTLGMTLRDAVASSVADVRARPTAAAWTGWALAASMHVMSQDPALPVPGRGDASSSPGLAFRIGRSLVVSAAHELV
jgi:hypothetical protein